MVVVYEFELWSRQGYVLSTTASGDREQALAEILDRKREFEGTEMKDTEVVEVTRRSLETQTPDAANDPEQYRRERATLDAIPVQGATFDYGHAGTLIDIAMHHLDEGLPNGQHLRCANAFVLLKRGVAELEKWMTAKGYFLSPEDIAKRKLSSFIETNHEPEPSK